MIGTNIDHYRIIERLGGGGMGEVYKALDLALDREVAIKCVRPELSDLEDVTRRFRAEARTLAKLSHPNIATVYRFFAEGGQLFLVMEYIAGNHFGSMLRQRGAMDASQAVPLLVQTLEGLGYAHDHQVVHRDIKPGNLMLDGNGMVKVLDFGIAHLLDGARMTQTGSVVGTPAYMAPEQVLGKTIDQRTDLYSLGIVLYEMLTGKLPFQANSDFELMRAHIETVPRSLHDLSPSVPPALQNTIMRALAKDTSERFQTAHEFADALRDSFDPDAPTLKVSRARAPRAPAPAKPAAVGEAGSRGFALPAAVGEWLDRARARPVPVLAGGGAVLAAVLAVGLLAGESVGPADDAAVAAPTAVAAPAVVAPAPVQSERSDTAATAAAAESLTAAADEPAVESSAPPPAARPTPASTPAQAVPPVDTPVQPAREVASLTPAKSTPSPAPRAAAAPLGSVRVKKIAVHERQGTGRFSRAAGYNGAFSLAVPPGGTRNLTVDEYLEVTRDGERVLRELVASELRTPGDFQSKQRVLALKQLAPGEYDVRLQFETAGRDLGSHRWKLEVVD